jgi:hypothetical protein
MWMHCYGALAQPENQQGDQSSPAADNGTASHTWAALCLEDGVDAEVFLGGEIELNGAIYVMDEERAGFIQTYLDEVRRRAIGGVLFVEHRVDLSAYLGMELCPQCKDQPYLDLPYTACPMCNGTGEVPQGGTADVVVILPEQKTLLVGDLKYGTGEKVWASYEHEGKRLINTQCGNYCLGVLDDAEMLGYQIERVVAAIYQPRLGHMDEFEITVAELREFGERVKKAVTLGDQALVLGPNDPTFQAYLHADYHICRWCGAKDRCEKLTAFVQTEVRADFEDIEESLGSEPLPVPTSAEHLSRAYTVLPLIELWVKAVKAALWKGVQAGEVPGPDGQPLKFVAGKDGKRFWKKDSKAKVEGLMVGQIGEEAYWPREIITAPAFEKLLKKRLKKAFPAVWKDVFEPLIDRAKPSITIAPSYDPRPTYGAADATEFEDESQEIDITE